MCSSPVSTGLIAIGVEDACLVGSIEEDTMFLSHHRSHRERNTLWPSSVDWKGVVESSYEQCVSGVPEINCLGTLCMCPVSFSTSGITFSFFSQFPQLLTTIDGKHDERTGNLPPLCSYLSLFRKKGKLVHLLAPAAR